MADGDSPPVKSAKLEDNSGNSLKKSEFQFTEGLTLEQLRQRQAKFIDERNWDQFHAPRNVLLALVGEVGELAEIFQWKGEVTEGVPELTAKEKEHLGQEMSDVLLYLVDLANKCHVDLPSAVLAKMAHNAEKYPKDKAFGRADKYNDL
ncbi:dCTP pyrophosphatase 1-like [Babylonia areolata]|uniref:dCTP pyrophosphatase 1-like n=1 Tax=Babylonia areolata TaxID=304850 RepID=UPI003FD4301E